MAFVGHNSSSSSNNNKRATALLVCFSFLLGFLASPLFTSITSQRNYILEASRGPEQAREYAQLVQFRTRCNEPVNPVSTRSIIIDRIFDGESPYLGFPPDASKPLLRESHIRGWGSTGSVFKRLIEEVNPRVVLELGTFLGASAIHMAKYLRNEAVILCVDDFRGWPSFHKKFKVQHINGDSQLLYQFMKNVQSMNLTDVILPVPFSTTSTMNAFCEWGVYADLIEVDAAHDFHSAWSDINLAYSLLSSSGVIFGHDYFAKADHRGVGRAVDMFSKLKGLRVETDEKHWILRR